MNDLPVAPGIGDKRPRGNDDQDDEIGNNVPPNLRSNSNQGGGQRQSIGVQQQQQWQGPGNQMMGGPNMAAANASLDALYVGDLNWVCIDANQRVIKTNWFIVDN